jgi:hypothetical protein
MKFVPRFLKNPLHFSFKFIYQLTYLMEAVLPYTEYFTSLKVTETTASTTVEDIRIFLKFVAGFAKSISSINEVENQQKTVSAADVQVIVDLCNDVDATMHSPMLQKYPPLIEDLTAVLGSVVRLFSSLLLEQAPPAAAEPSRSSLTDLAALKSVWHPRGGRQASGPVTASKKVKLDDAVLKSSSSGITPSPTAAAVILCVPCGTNRAIEAAPALLPFEPAARSRKRRVGLDEQDAFSRPNKHVYNGYCPCCD